MSKQIEQLSKNLANGMSRRQAAWRFMLGLGGVAGALFTARGAKANNGNNVCVALCKQQGLTGSDFGACVSASAHCPAGECAAFLNGHFICMPV